MTLFHKELRGISENVLEDTISNYPINANHNPFCNHSFNGGDFTQLSTIVQKCDQRIRK